MQYHRILPAAGALLMAACDGGVMTRVFDESVFPEGIVPQPGPFEPWITGTAGDQGTASTAAASAGAGGLWFWVDFFTEDRHGDDIAMDGAEAKAEYIERGQHVTMITRTVPADGIVKFPCTGYAEQHVSGSVKNPTSAQVKGGQRLSYFQARYHHCGDTLEVRGARHYYLPYTFLVYAIPEIESHFGYYRSRMNWEWDDFDEDDDDPPTTYYSGRHDKIVFRNFFDYHWVSAHEFGHALHKEKLGGLWGAGCPSPHYVGKVSNYKCALQEGIADYAGNIGSPRNEWIHGDWETARYTPPYHRGYGEIEGNVAALFEDLIDDNNEGNDKVSLRPYDVMTVFKTCRNSGGKRNDTADFVWCLENRVDTMVHRIRFPGLSAPQNPSSTRPSGWDADDIRKTWIQSVG